MRESHNDKNDAITVRTSQVEQPFKNRAKMIISPPKSLNNSNDSSIDQ